MTVTYRYKTEKPIVGRYVKYDGAGVYSFCETGQPTRRGWVYDEAQGKCSVDDLPPNVAMAAIALHNERVWPPYVEWPL